MNISIKHSVNIDNRKIVIQSEYRALYGSIMVIKQDCICVRSRPFYAKNVPMDAEFPQRQRACV